MVSVTPLPPRQRLPAQHVEGVNCRQKINSVAAWMQSLSSLPAAPPNAHPTLQAVAAILVTPFRPSGWLSRPTAFRVLDRLASQPAAVQ